VTARGVGAELRTALHFREEIPAIEVLVQQYTARFIQQFQRNE